MKQVFNETINGIKIVIVEKGDQYQAAAFDGQKQVVQIEGRDVRQLKSQLRNKAGELHPNYFGFDGAIKRFLEFFPDGFADERYFEMERNYKLDAHEKLTSALPLESVIDGSIENGNISLPSTNLLSRFENARLMETIKSDDGKKFLEGAAKFATGNIDEGVAGMSSAISSHGRIGWALTTYLPYLWKPNEHMFLKPEATKDFAERVGHSFAIEYSAQLNAGVYMELQDLVRETQNQLNQLNPKDRIDVQSFIWVVGSYSDKELPT